MNAAELADIIVEFIETCEEADADPFSEPDLEGVKAETFRGAALMTRDDGVIFTLRDTSEFQMTIVQSKKARR